MTGTDTRAEIERQRREQLEFYHRLAKRLNPAPPVSGELEPSSCQHPLPALSLEGRGVFARAPESGVAL